METKRMLMIAMSISILFVQEQLLAWIPNVQFSVLLIITFSAVFSFKEMVMLITTYVILDNMYMGGLDLFTMVPMYLAWMLIPISYHTILRKTTNETKLAVFAFFFGFIYSWMFIPFNMMRTGIDSFIPYLIADIWFEVVLAVFSSISIIWLFRPVYSTLCMLMGNCSLQPKRT